MRGELRKLPVRSAFRERVKAREDVKARYNRGKESSRSNSERAHGRSWVKKIVGWDGGENCTEMGSDLRYEAGGVRMVQVDGWTGNWTLGN